MSDTININKRKIERGEFAEVILNIARLPTYTEIDLPVYVKRAENPGPVLLLTGGLHGDEINGVEIVRRILTKHLDDLEAGSVVAMPLVNVYGFIQNVRGLPDGKDINRSFPGIKNGSLARQLAHTLMKEIIPQIDYGIDFHTGGAARSNYPQLRGVLKIEENLKIAKAFAPPVILNSSFIDKTFRKAANKLGKHILVYETGESLRFDEYGINEAVEGTLRLMKSLKMISSAPTPNEKTEIYGKSTWVRAKYSGLFHPRVDIGEHIKRRQVLGNISDPFGQEKFKTVATRGGRVIGLNYSPVISKGDALLHLAYDKLS